MTYCYLGLFFCLPCSVVIVLTVKSGIHRHVPGWEKKWWTRQQFKLSLPGFSFKVLYTKLCAAGIWTMQSYCHTPPNLKLSLISKITPGFFPWQELTLSVPEVGTALNVTCWKKDQDRLYSRDQTSVFLNVLVKYYALHWAFYIVTVFDTCYSDCSDHHTSLSKNVAIWFFLLLSLASFEDMLFFTLFILIVQWLCLGCWQCCDTCSEFRS